MNLAATAKTPSGPLADAKAKRSALRVEKRQADTHVAERDEAAVERDHAREQSPYTHNFGSIPLHSGAQPIVQPKLTVSRPGDKYEQEADKMAERVMRMPEQYSPVTGDTAIAVQRKCEACEDDDKDKKAVMRKEESSEPGYEGAENTAVSEHPVMLQEDEDADANSEEADKEAVEDKVMPKEDVGDAGADAPEDNNDAGDDGVMPKEDDAKTEDADTDEAVMPKEEDTDTDEVVMPKEEDADTDEAVMPKEDDSKTEDTDTDEAVMSKDEDADTEDADTAINAVMSKQEDPDAGANSTEEEEGQENQVMRKPGKPGHDGGISPSWHHSLNNSKSGGAPLPPVTKNFMEGAFRTDFSSVRVHTDSRAADMSKGIRAKAFTHGHDIYFNSGQFTPERPEGKKLLAHELTHVIQQRNGSLSSLLQRKLANEGLAGGQQGGAAVNTPATAMPAQADAAPVIENKAALNADTANPAVQAPAEKANAPAKPGKEDNKQPAGGGGGGGGKATAAEKGKQPADQPQKADTSNGTAYLASLQQQEPVPFIDSMKTADADVNQIHGKEKEELQKEMPVIDQPTGLPTLEKTSASRAAMQSAAAKKQSKKLADDKKAKKEILPLDKVAEKPPVKAPPLPAQQKAGDQASFEKALSNTIDALPETDNSINTSLGPRPAPDLSGDANPQQIDQEVVDSESVVAEQQANADQLTKQDFGENNVYPDVKPGKLKPENKLSPIPASKGQAIKPATITPDVAESFNKNAAKQKKAETDAQVQKNNEAVSKMQEDKEKEKAKGMQQIDDETLAVKQKQEKEQSKAKKEVSNQRENWTAENEKIRKKYADSSKAESESTGGKIDQSVTKANSDVEAKFSESENKIADEKAKADQKAADKKKEAEAKKDSGGFFDAVGNFLSSVWDSIKEAVNFIFDALRKAVKVIIEAVKTAVSAIIDAVRDLVVGLIKAFGEVLKTLVSIALAAFPELAKKINALIDKAVDFAVDVVNKLAEGLKAIANKLLDALGAALDFILAAYQKIYNAIIDALKFLTAGLLALLQGLANLVSGAKESPNHFWSQVSIEVIGQDITMPLPNEIGYDKQKDETQIGGGFETMEYGEKLLGIKDKEKEPEAEQPELKPEDVVNNDVDHNLQLNPEFSSQLQEKGDGETEFGGTPENETALDDARTDAAKADAAKAEAEPAADPATVQAAKQTAGDIVNNAGKVGPFKNAWERGQHVLKQIKDAMSKWWSANSTKVIAGLIAGLLAGAILEVVTGGAITAAIPVIMEIVSALFAAQDIMDGVVFLGEYITSSWVGQIAKGAMALARTFVKLIMAFIFDLIGGGEIKKGIKSGIKAFEEGGAKGIAKLAKTAAKNAVTKQIKNVAKLGGIAKNGAKAALKNGKLVLNGIKGGLKNGAKTFGELAEGLLKKFRFKKFKIVIKKFRFYLYGEVNPWVLLADGTLVKTESKGGVEIGGKVEVTFFTKSGKIAKKRPGFLVSIGGTKKAARFKGFATSEGKKLYRDLNAILRTEKSQSKAALRLKELVQEKMPFDVKAFARKYGKASAKVVKNRGSLAKGFEKRLGKALPKYIEAHHVVPVELISKNEVVRKAINGRFAFNGKVNGELVKRYSSKVKGLANGVHASHPNYTKRVEQMIDAAVAKKGILVANLSDKDARKIVESVAKKVKKAMKNNPMVLLDKLPLK